MRSQSTEHQKSRHSHTHLICDWCCVLVNSFFKRSIVTTCPMWQLAPVYHIIMLSPHAKRFSAMVLCCLNEGRNVNSGIALSLLKTLIAKVLLIIFLIKISWHKKHQFHLRKMTSCVLFLNFTNFCVIKLT